MTDLERRRFKRIRIGCKITVHSGKHNVVLTSCTENIAEGGIRLFLKSLLDIDSAVNIELFLFELHPLQCKGKVIWSLPAQRDESEHRFYDTGIEFVDLADTQIDRIKKLMGHLPSRAKG